MLLALLLLFCYAGDMLAARAMLYVMRAHSAIFFFFPPFSRCLSDATPPPAYAMMLILTLPDAVVERAMLTPRC